MLFPFPIVAARVNLLHLSVASTFQFSLLLCVKRSKREDHTVDCAIAHPLEPTEWEYHVLTSVVLLCDSFVLTPWYGWSCLTDRSPVPISHMWRLRK
eukprot:6480893-Amphidinium_carterae.1